MGWSDKGEERMRKFEAYRSLEQKYQETLAEQERLLASLRAKDATIKALAGELAGMAAEMSAASRMVATERSEIQPEGARKASGLIAKAEVGSLGRQVRNGSGASGDTNAVGQTFHGMSQDVRNPTTSDRPLAEVLGKKSGASRMVATERSEKKAV